jgi:hypothetical protein
VRSGPNSSINADLSREFAVGSPDTQPGDLELCGPRVRVRHRLDGERPRRAADLEARAGRSHFAVMQVNRDGRAVADLADQVQVVGRGHLDGLACLGDPVPRMLDRSPCGRLLDRAQQVLDQVEAVAAENLHQSGGGCSVIGVGGPIRDGFGGAFVS